MYRHGMLPDSFGDWLEDHEESGAPELEREVAITAYLRLRAAMVIGLTTLGCPSQESVIEIFKSLNELAAVSVQHGS